MASVAIRNFTRRPSVPRVPYERVAQAVLPGWEVSLVFVGATRARSLNQRLCNKTYVPNVLSYTLGTKSGEIIICLGEADRQAPRYEMSRDTFVLFLFIHGLLHLEGRAHGATMEAWEQKLLARFAKGAVRPLTHEPEDNHRHRHRDVPGQAGRRRRDR